jgi:hypothetical protein
LPDDDPPLPDDDPPLPLLLLPPLPDDDPPLSLSLCWLLRQRTITTRWIGQQSNRSTTARQQDKDRHRRG